MGDGQKQMGEEEKTTIFIHLQFWDCFPNINEY